MIFSTGVVNAFSTTSMVAAISSTPTSSVAGTAASIAGSILPPFADTSSDLACGSWDEKLICTMDPRSTCIPPMKQRIPTPTTFMVFFTALWCPPALTPPARLSLVYNDLRLGLLLRLPPLRLLLRVRGSFIIDVSY
jgi:hypothetical protein